MRVEPRLGLGSLKISRWDKWLRCRINCQKIWSEGFRSVKRTFGLRPAKGDAAARLSEHIGPLEGLDYWAGAIP